MSSGCNSCANLDPDAKKPGESGGYLYFCKAKGTYVNAAKDGCDQYENGYRDSFTMNEIYRNSDSYSNTSSNSMGAYIFILIIMLILGLIFGVFFK